MILKSLSLQNFRNYTKAEFHFNPHTTLSAGPNASGKSNLLESIWLLSTGKSNRLEKEQQLIRFRASHSRVTGSIETYDADNENKVIEIALSNPSAGLLHAALQRKYLVNGVAKRRSDFAGNLTAVLFTPVDLE